MLFPKTIFMDTNILIRLPLDGIPSDLLTLIDWCKEFKIDLFITETVQKEYLYNNQEVVSKGISKVNEGIKLVNSRILSKIPLVLSKEEEQTKLLKETEDMINNKLVDLGIKIIKKPDILEKLEEMALKTTRPFDGDGRKGFRDATILLTILEYAKDFPQWLHIFITDDKIFLNDEQTQLHKDIEITVKKYGVSLKISKSIGQAIEDVKASIETIIKKVMEEKENNLINYLNPIKDKILEFIRKEAKFNSFMLELGEPGEPSLSGTIEKINSIEFDSIISARPALLPSGKEEDRVKISFMVKLKLSVSVTEFLGVPGKQLRLGQYSSESQNPFIGSIFSGTTGAPYPSFEFVNKDKVIIRKVSVEANAILSEKNGLQEYKDIVLEKTLS